MLHDVQIVVLLTALVTSVTDIMSYRLLMNVIWMKNYLQIKCKLLVFKCFGKISFFNVIIDDCRAIGRGRWNRETSNLTIIILSPEDFNYIFIGTLLFSKAFACHLSLPQGSRELLCLNYNLSRLPHSWNIIISVSCSVTSFSNIKV